MTQFAQYLPASRYSGILYNMQVTRIVKKSHGPLGEPFQSRLEACQSCWARFTTFHLLWSDNFREQISKDFPSFFSVWFYCAFLCEAIKSCGVWIFGLFQSAVIDCPFVRNWSDCTSFSYVRPRVSHTSHLFKFIVIRFYRHTSVRNPASFLIVKAQNVWSNKGLWYWESYLWLLLDEKNVIKIRNTYLMSHLREIIYIKNYNL